MSQPSIMVASSGARPQQVERFARALLLGSEANDQPQTLPDVRSAPDLRSAEPDDIISSCDALIILNPDVGTSESAIELIETLSEAALPVLVMHPDPSGQCAHLARAGAMVLPDNSPEQVVGSVVRGLLHGHRSIRELRRELNIARRFHGGLSGEIKRMHEELQLAAMVQRDYLPSTVPSANGIEFAVLYRPSNYVSGDIYDIKRIDDDHIGVFLADAVGHGVPAALMTMAICRSLTMFVEDAPNHDAPVGGGLLAPPGGARGGQRRILRPCEVLGRLNEQMIRQQGENIRFATAVYALFNIPARTVVVAGAGHPPPVLMRSEGDVEEVTTSGGLLGVFENEQFDEATIDLHENDRLLLYSDGFEQAFPEQSPDRQGVPGHAGRMPTNRYRAEFLALRQCPSAQTMVEQLQSRLDGESGSLHQVDDLTGICTYIGAAQRESSHLTPSRSPAALA